VAPAGLRGTLTHQRVHMDLRDVLGEQLHQVLPEVSVQLGLDVELVLKTLKRRTAGGGGHTLPRQQSLWSRVNRSRNSYQVHEHRNDALKRRRVLRQRNVKVLDEVLRRAGLVNNNNNVDERVSQQLLLEEELLFGLCVFLPGDEWKPVGGDLLFSTSSRCRAAQNAAGRHTCRRS